MAVNPYLFFGGNCRDAFTRYHEIFGGDLQVMRMGDMPAGETPPPPEQADLVMHAALRFGDDLLMGSDDPGDFHGAHGMMVSLSFADPSDVERVYNALADGGHQTLPLTETFWSPKFGMCIDRFGTPWMVGVESQMG